MADARLAQLVYDALKHLGDRAYLRHCSLAQRLHVAGARDPGASLRRILTDAIEAFRPVPTARHETRDCRRFAVLHGRYVEQLPQEILADRLGISSRHLRREQAAAIEALATYIAMQYDLGFRQDAQDEREDRMPPADTELNREMLWLVESSGGERANVATAIQESLRLAEVLAAQHRIMLSHSRAEPSPFAAVSPTVLRQIVLSLLSAVIQDLPPESAVDVSTHEEADLATITIVGRPSQLGVQRRGLVDSTASDMSRRMAELFDGQLAISEIDGRLLVRVTLPSVERDLVVLAVEDNRDTLHMWRRYLQHTRFQLVAEPQPERAVTTAAALQPDLVVLDVMLGGMDGWEVLRRLRQDTRTCGLRVVICSVLPQQQLALSLGADGFVLKPATGPEFRAALQSQFTQ